MSKLDKIIRARDKKRRKSRGKRPKIDIFYNK